MGAVTHIARKVLLLRQDLVIDIELLGQVGDVFFEHRLVGDPAHHAMRHPGNISDEYLKRRNDVITHGLKTISKTALDAKVSKLACSMDAACSNVARLLTSLQGKRFSVPCAAYFSAMYRAIARDS